MPQAQAANLFFSEWSEVESLASFDRTRVQISTDAANWTTIFESHGTAGVWADRSVDISQYLGGDIYLRFWFDTGDSFFNNFEGWHVDDVLILAQGANAPPLAVNDGYSVNEDALLAITAPGVLANDTDSENDSLTAILVSGPANGGVVLNANGSFTYTPALNFNGADSFTYKANDGVADSNVATVSITVNPVNDPPAADPGGPYNGTAGVAVAFNGSNSTDPENSPLTYDWDFGDASPHGTGVSPSHTYAAPGLYTVTLVVNDGLLDSPPVSTTANIIAAPQAGTMHVHDLDAFSVKLSKGNWFSSVTIEVRDASDSVVAGIEVVGTFFQNGSPLVTLTCNTDGNGRCTINSIQWPSKSGKGKSFTVQSVTDPTNTLTYDSNANHDPDGDSDGTTIQLSK